VASLAYFVRHITCEEFGRRIGCGLIVDGMMAGRATGGASLAGGGPMSDERYLEISHLLDEFGWTYNSTSKQFESISEDDKEEADESLPIDWDQLAGSLPEVSEEELREYVARRDQEE
jgi:hypothetical protein